MAVHQATRSNPQTQPQPQHAKTGRAAIPDGARAAQSGGSEPQPTDHQRKAELFKTLERLNHGYGVALTALDRLRKKDRKRVFPAACLNDFRNRTELLRALANRDLLRLLAGHEEQEAARLGEWGSVKCLERTP
jgi:hypothetical protein